MLFFYKDKPKSAGIMDSVDLSYEAQLQQLQLDQKNGIHYIKGPIELESSNEFIMFFHVSRTHEYKARVYKRPCENSQMIISDIKEKVKFSTLLDKGQILIQINKSFLLFNEIA